MVINMSDKSDRLVDLIAEREALRQASGSSSLEGILAGISAEITRRAQERKPDTGSSVHVAVIKTPDIDAKPNQDSWPDDQEFPLTPLEAWYLMRGYSVKPSREVSNDVLKLFPGDVQHEDGYIRL